MSDYTEDKKSEKWCRDKIPILDESTGEIIAEKPIYIMKPQNIGENMALDDKQIGRDMFSILSNQKTGKIALMVETLKVNELKLAFDYLDKSTEIIQQISCDMSPSYLKLCREYLPKSQIVIDKFHVIKYVYDAVQLVRNRIKKQVEKSLPKRKDIKSSSEDEVILTDLELLQRTRYLLNQSPDKWNDYQKEMMEKLFEKYVELKNAYELAQSFKSWYDINNKSKNRIIQEQLLYHWYEKVENTAIEEFKSVVKMIERHEDYILNYFKTGLTNAKAETLNGKIQRFITSNYGIRDKDFAIYRMAGYFS